MILHINSHFELYNIIHKIHMEEAFFHVLEEDRITTLVTDHDMGFKYINDLFKVVSCKVTNVNIKYFLKIGNVDFYIYVVDNVKIFIKAWKLAQRFHDSGAPYEDHLDKAISILTE